MQEEIIIEKQERINKIVSECEKSLKKQFARLEDVALFNQEKVLKAFWNNKIALRHFNGSSGYGIGDDGRDALCSTFACAFGAEKAIVSPAICSGTQAITVGLFGILRPGDLMLSVTGDPYDTLRDVVGGSGIGSLADFNVKYDKIPLKNGKINLNKALDYLKNHDVKMVYIQRSRGYEWREALSVNHIGEVVSAIKSAGFSGCVFVDNCYGEFVEKYEPTEVGADVCCGSLIKNAGGGIAPTGGYVAGKAKYIELVEGRLTAPSIGAEEGSYALGYQYFYQGLFLAPHVVLQALKGSMLVGKAMEKLGYKTLPAAGKPPYDITRSIVFGEKQKLIDFIQSVQEVSPVDSFVTVCPSEMPGYNDEVVMAAGCFVQGASIELSADAPVRAPFIAYIQGGLTYEHQKIALYKMLAKLI